MRHALTNAKACAIGQRTWPDRLGRVTQADGLAHRLAARTLALVDVPSPSRHEARLAERVAREVSLELVFRDEGALLYATSRRPGRPLVLLAGHLDTVPAQGNIPGRIENGAVWGLGASDMKGGLAVMLELAATLPAEPALDVAFLFFAREELPAEESALPAVFAGAPLVDEAELVIVLEPTDNAIQVGCLGNLNATLTFTGVSAHSARPWLGVNAVALAVDGLAPIVRLPPREVEVGGLCFKEVVTVTGIEGGIAANVVPDRVTCRLNYRYAPDRSPAEAENELRKLVGGEGTLVLDSNSPPAHVVADSALLERLCASGGFAVEPKQAWTPVAEFAARGLDAVNLGPGAPRWAHTRDEQVEAAALARTYEALRRFLTDERGGTHGSPTNPLLEADAPGPRCGCAGRSPAPPKESAQAATELVTAFRVSAGKKG